MPQINNATASPATATFTPSAGSNRLIVIEVTNIPNNTTVTTISATYGSNNVPATYVVDSANNQRRQAWLFYLTEADIATAIGNTITVTNNNAVNFSVNIATFSGVDQAAPITASGGQYINNTSPTLNYPSALSVNAGGYGIIGAGSNTTGGTIGESYTDHGETTVGAGFSRLGSLAFGASGTTNPGVTYGANVRGGVAGCTLNPSPAGSPGTLQLSSSTYSVNENGTSVTITATRTGGSAGAASVNYTTSNGTATAGSDYTSTSGTLSWADGDSADKTFTVNITNDTAVEGNEDFNVTLSGASGASLGTPNSATVTIMDDDATSAGTLQYSSSTYSVNENGTFVTITVTRVGGSSGAVGVSYSTSDGTATAGSDYTSASGSLSWADGDTADKTFTVNITDDGTVEGNETFNTALSSPTGGASLGTPNTSTVTIVDNDGAPPAVPAGNAMLLGILFISVSFYGLMKSRGKKV
jgi:ribosomal protein L35AE/L33A